MRVELVGGLHDGRERGIARRPSSYVYIEAQPDSAHAVFMLHANDGAGRTLYKFDRERKGDLDTVLYYVYAGDVVIRCPGCSGFHQRGPEKCTVCGAHLTAVK